MDKSRACVYLQQIIRAADETCEDMVPDNRLFSKREALLQQVTEQNSFDSAVELVRNHIGEIFQTLSDANSSSGQRQARLALDYIQKNYMDPDLSLNSICSYLNISTSYFSTIFKDLTGETFTEVLIRTRMEKAKELLDKMEQLDAEYGVAWLGKKESDDAIHRLDSSLKNLCGPFFQPFFERNDTIKDWWEK